jgi:hypothetical protein
MQEFPYNYPTVLTDAIFLLYGGQTGTSSDATRQVAYMLSEQQVTEYLQAFIMPTTVTGTYFWKSGNPIMLDYGHIIQVNQVVFSSVDGCNSCAVDTVTGCHAVRGSGEYGLIDVAALANCGGCSSIVGLYPYNVQISYTSGLQTGTTHQPPMLQALTLAAQINLNELDVSLSNEGTADIGIQSFTNQKYSEIRAKLGNSVFGNSAVAQRIARLIRKYKSRPSIGFH